MIKRETSQKNRLLPVVIVFVFAAKTVFFADAKIALAEKRPEATLELDNPPFEPLPSLFGDAAIAKVLALKNLATSGSEKISGSVYAVGNSVINSTDQFATVGESVAEAAHRFYCTVSGWLGVGCEITNESISHIFNENDHNSNVDVPVTPPVINRREDQAVEFNIDVRKEYNSSDDDATSNDSNVVNQTVIVNGITEAELERRLAIFKNSLDLSSGVRVATRSYEGNRVSTDRIYEDMNEAADNAAVDAVTGGDLSFSGINGTFSGDVSVAGALSVTGTTTLSGPLSVNGSTGVAGYVLQSTGTSAQWVATSTLGISGGGGGGVWGGITGTLSDQTDLQSVLDTKITSTVSAGLTFSGSASNINLGSNFISGDGDNEGLYVDSTGKVGIGTTTLNNILHVYAVDSGTRLTRDGTLSGAETVLNIVTPDNDVLSDGDGGGISFRISDADQAELSIASVTAVRSGADNSGALRFQTANAGSLTTKMTIAPSGHVGIGTCAPDKALEVNLGTTNALRLSYDDVNGSAATYFDTTLSSTGTTTFDTIGTSTGFVFNDAVRLASLTSDGFVKTTGGNGTLTVDTTAYLSCVNNLSLVEVGSGNAVIAATNAVAVGISNCACNASGGASAFGSLSCALGYRSTAMGRHSVASGDCSTASGYYNTSSGASASTFGTGNLACGTIQSSAVGFGNRACGTQSSAMGNANISSGCRSNTFGYVNTASGTYSTASGYCNIASALNSVSMGRSNFTSTGGLSSIAVGILNNQTGGTIDLTTGAITGTPSATTTVARLSTAVGVCNTTSGTSRAVAVGFCNVASGDFKASAVGVGNTASARYTNAFGTSNTASGYASNALGTFNTTSATQSTASGYLNTASGSYSSVFGYRNIATTANSVVMGRSNFTGTGIAAVSIGILNNQTGGAISTAGVITLTPTAANSGCLSTAVGVKNTSSGAAASAFGYCNIASGACAIAVGSLNTADCFVSSAFGVGNTISNNRGTAIGFSNNVSALGGLAVGCSNTVSANQGTAIGHSNSALASDSVAIGRYNFSGSGSGSASLSFGLLNNSAGTGSIDLATGSIIGTPAAVTSGVSSIALGICNCSTAAKTLSLGHINKATVGNAVAVGYGNTSSACYSASFGYNLANTQANSVKIGPSDCASILICCTGASTGVVKFNGGIADGALSLVSGVLTSASDERLKDIRGDFTGGLTEILAINPIEYTWKESTPFGSDTLYSGFSAQNIKSVIPTAVATGSDGYYGLDDRPILAASVNAIKQLNTKSLTTDALALQNATDIVSIKTLLGTDGMSAATLARFETLDLDVADIYTLIDAQSEEIITLSDRVDDIFARLESFGATVYEGIVTFVDVVAKKITASEVIINNEDHPEKTGLIIYDRKTGEPICVYFENGEMKTQQGECEEVEVDDDEDNNDVQDEDVAEGDTSEESNDVGNGGSVDEITEPVEDENTSENGDGTDMTEDVPVETDDSEIVSDDAPDSDVEAPSEPDSVSDASETPSESDSTDAGDSSGDPSGADSSTGGTE